MRKLSFLMASLPLALNAAEEPAQPARNSANSEVRQDIVVTAVRDERSAFRTPASISRIEQSALADLSAKHQADALNRSAGVYIQRGSGAESLGAIRSPVLAGAGACGAFLVAEDSVPIRPTGFCNLNEMFELNYEQAGRLEVLRGPASAMFGASAVHGVVNLITPSVWELPRFSAGIEGGSDSFKRVRASASHLYDDRQGFGFYGVATRAPGWRDSSGVDEAKLNLLADFAVGGGNLRLRASGTVLNQETAGFIQGRDSYRSESLSRVNLNPEAFRDASSARLSAHYTQPDVFVEDGRLQISGIYRRSRMDFLQHFLIGKPLEHNAQTSFMLSSTVSLPAGRFTTRLALDAEQAQSELTEFQPGPATDGAPAANAIRPAGLHYDYTVDSTTFGGTLALEYRVSEQITVTAALRADQTRYDYDNHMIDGNTAANGTACPGGCLFSRPADRRDRFDNASPSLTLAWQPDWTHFLYVNASSGFRPPETTEMYRLQRLQSAADLDSESLQSLEVGWKAQLGRYALSTALYEMKKRDLILRETNGFNVSNGSTRHRGFEYELSRDLGQHGTLQLAGTVASHEYTFGRAVEGGETIVFGNEVDTAPRQLHTLSFTTRVANSPGGGEVGLGLDVSYVGRYFLDAANTATYPGHTVASARLGWERSGFPRIALRIDNLLDRRYADRADFAFGNYRYFPARGRALFLSLDYDTH